jgi:hypothetical protein
MKSLPNSTNGVIVLSDSFATSIFKQSFLRIFNKDDQGHLQMGFNATFDVQVRLPSRFILSIASLTYNCRRLKNLEFPVSLATRFQPAKNLPALVRPKLV